MTTSSLAKSANDSEEERSLLFSDSEQESSHAGDISNDDNDLQWEDFMLSYWGNNNDNNEFQIALNADKIVTTGDMTPLPLEPELDNSYTDNLQLSEGDVLANSADSEDEDNNMMLIKILSEAGLQSTVQMAKLNDFEHSKSSRTKKEAPKKKKKQLQDEFSVDMTNIPMTSASTKRKSKLGVTTAASAFGMQMQRIQINPETLTPGAASDGDDTRQSSDMIKPASSPQQQEESLEDSLFAMAQRLSPGNDVSQQQQQQQQQQQLDQQSAHNNRPQLHGIPQQSDSPLPNPDLIHQMGPIHARTSLRSLLMKKWHPSWWMHYDKHSLLIFRSKDHLDDWVQNPYHGKKERAYLVKLRVDFDDIVGGSGSYPASNGGSGNTNNSKEGILGHRILPVKKKSYSKNEPEMYQFKLERWTNMGVSVLAAFASEEEEDVQLLYDTILDIMATCPYGGLHNIDHMLQH